MFLLLLWFCVCDSEQCRMITIFIAIEMPRAQVVSTPPPFSNSGCVAATAARETYTVKVHSSRFFIFKVFSETLRCTYYNLHICFQMGGGGRKQTASI